MLIPDEDLEKVIPSGAKVFIRWSNRTRVDAHRLSLSRRRSSAAQTFDQLLGVGEHDGAATGAVAGEQSLDSLAGEQPLDSPGAGNPFPRRASPELFSVGIVLLALIGLVLLFSLSFLLFRLLHKEGEEEAEDDDVEGQRRRRGAARELRLVLVPKPKQQHSGGRRKSSLPSVTSTGRNGSIRGKRVSMLLNSKSVDSADVQPQLLNPKPFPRRIYELQAEEGYFSCPPSMRASFDIDNGEE